MSVSLNRLLVNAELLITGETTGNRGSKIVFGKDLTGKKFSVIVRAHVLARAVQIGESWYFTGEWDTDPKYPNQIIATQGEPVSVTGERLAEYIIRHPKLRCGEGSFRIGKKTWENAIEAASGADNLTQLLDNEDKSGIKALNIGRLTHNVDEILFNWSMLQGELNGLKLLAKHKVKQSLSKKLIRQYGEQVPELLETDCFKLLAYDRNTKALFQSCQHIADALSYLENDPRRLQGAVDFVLNYRLDNYGHTAISPEILKKALIRLFRDETLAQNAIDNALTSKAILEAPNGLLQSRPVAFVETKLEHRFVKMLNTHTETDEALQVTVALKARTVFADAEYPLTQEQQNAIQLPFQSHLSIITGFAGTGKTTVISSVIHLATLLDVPVYQMALSGQACDVMRRYNIAHDIDCLARTIHWYVLPQEAAREANEGNEKSENKLPFEFAPNSLIIIDECSMVDLSLMNRLVRILPESARILMVGDPNQIPPIGAGLVFHVLCQSKTMPVARLTIAHRSAAQTGIPKISRQISEGIPPVLPVFDLNKPAPGHGVYFLPTNIDRNDQDSLAKVLFQVASSLGIENTQVITTHRKKTNQSGVIPASVHYINDYFQKQLTTGKGSPIKAWGLNEGDPVIVRKNVIDVGGKEFDLFNGNLGTLTSAEKPYQFQFNEDIRELDDDDIAKLGIQLGYGLTIHSFQGSASDCIVIAVTRSNLMERSLLYTALTRAKRTCVFVGDTKAFEDAVSAQPKWQRISTGFGIDRYFEQKHDSFPPGKFAFTELSVQ